MIKWPDNKKFAFTIFDDTDFATLANVSEVYSFLSDLGLRTTKSVWPSTGVKTPICGGSTCEDIKYLDWILRLKDNGFEIGYHMNTYHTSQREETIAGLQRFKELIGHTPITMANHAGCNDNIYWGADRLSGINKLIYNLATHFKNKNKYRGHIDGDPLFWGDLCKEQIRYCRSFVYPEINCLKTCPIMPYHDPRKPFVNYWFVSAEGPTLNSFNERFAESEQDRLEEEEGACIMYTHFASGFQEGRKLNQRFKYLMERLSKKNGWFVPVSTLLDYLHQMNGNHKISDEYRRKLEWQWLKLKLLKGTS